MFSKQTFRTLLFLLVMGIAIAGCSNTDGNSDAGDNQNTDSEWAGQTLRVHLIGDFDMEDATDPITGETTEGLYVLKEEFENQHPGATVQFITMPWEGYTEKTQAMITSGEADVYQMPGIADFAPQGVLEPLQSYIDEDPEFDPEVFIDNQIEGWQVLGPDSDELQTYGLPFQGDARFIAYDKQIFDDWGVEYLSDHPTMEEVMEKAEQMTGENPVTGKQNYGVWFRGDFNSAFPLINLAEGQNGRWGTGFAWDEIEFEFNSPEMITGLEWLLDVQEYAPSGITSNQGNERWLTEENDIAIMLHQSPGEIVKAAMVQGIDDKIGIAQEFKNDEGLGGMLAGSPIAISADSDHKDLAWEWLKFATSDFAQQYVYENLGSMPVIKAASEWDSYAEVEHLLDPMLEAMSTPWTPRYPWGASQPRYILTSEVEAALTGSRSAEEALDKAQQESTEWLENRN
ncbi:extracellular solute-binding protein [Gracilibacillus alcaliphilus]|uniref:extracellular solute-binding protein n=1 Tax=Gracilibacillus alcaliphilus TaxID=1401441 RepID=UPI001EF8540E|nr:extracellular solute-binding protein [Gracilibacillus alcaliphilus]MBM7678996.1 ABC-type glycerol-3-phosphate transport system substrate-binding protein [Gracilibacillus alcaliphilus]